MVDNSKNENTPLVATASVTQRSEELGFGLMKGDSSNHDGIAGDYHHNNTTIPLPVISVPPLPNLNMNETSQCYSKEIEPAGGNYMIDSSQFKSAENFRMDHHYPYEGQECKPLPCRPDSGFSYPEGYTVQPYHYTRYDNLRIPEDVMNAAFNLNSFERPHSGGKCVAPSVSSVGRPQIVNRSGTQMSHNVGQPNLNMNFGMEMFNPNQGYAEPLLAPGKLDDKLMTIGSGSNRESKSNTIMPRINAAGNSERIFLPPTNTYHNQLATRSFVNPSLDMNGDVSGFQNNGQVMPGLSQAGNHEVSFDSIPGLRWGPSYAFQRPTSGDQNHFVRQGFERFMALPPLPYVGSQTMPCDSGQSTMNGQLVPPSIGMVTVQSSSELLPENNGRLSSQSFASPSFVVASGSTRRQDSSSNYGQTQDVGSIQQSNSPLGPQSSSDLGIQIGKGNMASQVSRPPIMASLKRAASQPPSATVQDHQRRKTLPAHSFIHPSIPTWTRVAPSVPNTPQAIPPLVNAAQSLTPQPPSFVPPAFPSTWTKSALLAPPVFPSTWTESALAAPPVFPSTWTKSALSAPPVFPSTWTKSALSAPNIAQSQTIHPLIKTAPFISPHDKRISSLHPISLTPHLPNQQLVAQSLAHQRLRTPIIPTVPSIAPIHIKYKEQTPEPIGHKCFLCKRDLSFTPEGPISQPHAPPAAAVLSCGHTFHDYCLERITPDNQSKDPPCIPCALRE